MLGSHLCKGEISENLRFCQLEATHMPFSIFLDGFPILLSVILVASHSVCGNERTEASYDFHPDKTVWFT